MGKNNKQVNIVKAKEAGFKANPDDPLAQQELAEEVAKLNTWKANKRQANPPGLTKQVMATNARAEADLARQAADQAKIAAEDARQRLEDILATYHDKDGNALTIPGLYVVDRAINSIGHRPNNHSTPLGRAMQLAHERGGGYSEAADKAAQKEKAAIELEAAARQAEADKKAREAGKSEARRREGEKREQEAKGRGGGIAIEDADGDDDDDDSDGGVRIPF